VAHDSGGAAVDLGARKGRVVLVVFFATWAQGSRGLLPQLQAVARTFKDKPLEVYGVAIDVDGRLVGPFVERLGLGFPILRDPGAQESESRLGLSVAPTVIVVDREGMIRAVHRGVQEDTAHDVEAELSRLLERSVRDTRAPDGNDRSKGSG
jgi:peroxiredoxin